MRLYRLQSLFIPGSNLPPSPIASPYEAKMFFFTYYFLIVYYDNSQSVIVWKNFDFDCSYGNKNGRKNRLKKGKWHLFSKFETLDREINIEHKQIPKIYFNRR